MCYYNDLIKFDSIGLRNESKSVLGIGFGISEGIIGNISIKN